MSLPEQEIEPHNPMTCELCHADGTAAEFRAIREAARKLISVYMTDDRLDSDTWREAINELEDAAGLSQQGNG